MGCSRLYLAPLLGTLLLAACAPVGPNYLPPPAALPAAWNQPQTETKVAVDQARWWRLFEDPLLEKLIEQAIAANQDLRIAESRIKAARGRYQIATGEAMPTLTGSAAASHSRRSDSGSSSARLEQDLFQAGFDAEWELDIFGGQRRSVEAATASLEAAIENRRAVLISLEGEVGRNYLEWRGSQQRLATAQKNLAAQQMTVATVQGRFGLGLASQLEVAEAETQLSLLAAQIPTLEKKISLSANQLALLLACQPAQLATQLTSLAQPGISAAPLSLPAVGLPSDLLRRRPDIRRVERLLAAATAEVGISTAELFPSFSLTASAGLQSGEFSDLLGSGSRFWSFGPSLKLPIFDRNKLLGALQVSEAGQEEQLATYEQTVLAALIEVEDGLVEFSREQQTRASLARATQTGRETVRFNEGLYQAGLADLTDVLASQRTLYQAEDQLIESEQQVALTVISLYKALGGGWELAEQSATAPHDAAHPPSTN